MRTGYVVIELDGLQIGLQIGRHRARHKRTFDESDWLCLN